MQSKSILALGALMLMASACGRALEPEAVSAGVRSRVIETPLSDEELSKRGEEVLYRFRSVPNLVLLKEPSPDAGIPIVSSPRVVSAQNVHRKSNLLTSLPRPRMDLAENPGEGHGLPFKEARFGEARTLLGNRGLTQVPVAILDSGVVPVTKPIQSVLWKATNFTTETDPCHWQNHGTAIASLLAGVTIDADKRHPCVVAENTPAGLTDAGPQPLAPNVRIHSVKISFDSDSLESLRADLGTLQLAVALDDAVASGARIVNLSFSYSQEDPPEEVRAVESLVMSHAAEKGVIFVLAAGNGGRKLDDRETFPARYGLENVVVVGSHDENLRLSSSSNFGDAVDLTAQGVALPANTRNGQVMLFSGTSFSAPIVLGALALYEGAFPDASLQTVLKDLFSSANPRYSGIQRSLEATGEESGAERPSRFGRLDVAAFVERGLQRGP